ncbi:hypothetical protein C7974DRAFT_378706 [Boeremia exigua]|uniref:uncharacterized protein n=1 Tax=Boeremia exigua TaxID=749465 RepID=UPI001E8ED1CB|nr:uncharacterized protein C7974DRAFT_378706 [Boeremia exigua]KAH6618509.1 hypothetical protein C7974DRAFT_378706 [Boeremia exigua]
MQLTTTLLVRIGMIALALGARADTDTQSSSISSTAFWIDTPTQKYHCEGRDVIHCETTVGGTCFTVDTCEEYCFKHDNGAACVDMGATAYTSDNIDYLASEVLDSTPEDDFAARDTSPQENEHYICSKDRRSILVCRYGFCSSDYYCKSNEKCSDDSVSCRSTLISGAPGSKSVIRTVVEGIKDTALKLGTRNQSSYMCSKDRASVLKCVYGFCATHYYCAKGSPCIDNPARSKLATAYIALTSILLSTEVERLARGETCCLEHGTGLGMTEGVYQGLSNK